MDEEICLVDSGTTNSILREIKYFQTLTKSKGNILKIVGRKIVIEALDEPLLHSLWVQRSQSRMQSCIPIQLIPYWVIEISTKMGKILGPVTKIMRILIITKDNRYGRDTIERIPSTPSRLYYSYIKPIQHVAHIVIFHNVNAFQTWHDCLCHPGTGMVRKITSSFVGHSLTNAKFLKSSYYTCTTCATRKLILKLSSLKIKVEPLNFLERIQGDIYGLINPLFGPFRYFTF